MPTRVSQRAIKVPGLRYSGGAGCNECSDSRDRARALFEKRGLPSNQTRKKNYVPIVVCFLLEKAWES
jgi:hypothetical protein